jgi:hypothetical protein
VSCDTEITGSRDLKPAAKTPSRHAGNDRRGKGSHGLAKIAQASDEFLGGILIETRHLLDIGATDHALGAFPGEDKNADVPVCRYCLKPVPDSLDDF